MVPLRIHVWFRHDSARAVQLANHLHELMSGPSFDWGPRISVRFGAADGADGLPSLQDGDAKRMLVVILADARMARAGTERERARAAAWASRIVELLDEHPPLASTKCSILPVALDTKGLQLSRLTDGLDNRSFVRLDGRDDEDARRQLAFHVTARAIRLLQDQAAADSELANELPPTNVELFVSHAKADQPPEQWRGAVAALFSAQQALPIEEWIDAREIPPGGRFDDEIYRGILRSSAMVVVLTDSYSTREWCRREILDAKAVGRPIVVVDAIESKVARLFPYLGNAPVVRWRAALAAEAFRSLNQHGVVPIRQEWEAEDATDVMLVTMMEALRYLHETARLDAERRDGVRVLGTHPEAITLIGVPATTTRVVYPDPPLGREELDRIRAARPDVELTTPLEQLARWEKPASLDLIALSLSGSPDADRFGGSPQHLATMAHDTALYLLLAGIRLLYGGVLDHRPAPGDDVNFVDRLIELVDRYSPLAHQVTDRPLAPIQSWVPWPFHLELSEDQRDKYSPGTAELTELPMPAHLERPTHDLSPRDEDVPGDTPWWRYARACGLTEMRRVSTEAASARIALGGKLSEYVGALPGVVEEVIFGLRAGKPVYLLGGFGGAARATIDLLHGRERVELTSPWCRENVGGWAELREWYDASGPEEPTPEDVSAELQERGAAGPAAALANGLSDAENEELFETTDARRAVELVLSGLRRVSGADG